MEGTAAQLPDSLKGVREGTPIGFRVYDRSPDVFSL